MANFLQGVLFRFRRNYLGKMSLGWLRSQIFYYSFVIINCGPLMAFYLNSTFKWTVVRIELCSNNGCFTSASDPVSRYPSCYCWYTLYSTHFVLKIWKIISMNLELFFHALFIYSMYCIWLFKICIGTMWLFYAFISANST